MRIAAISIGWLIAAAIVWLSLTPAPPRLEIEEGDKIGHFIAYGLLMLWFCGLYARFRVRLAYAAGWIAMGIALEFAQRALGTRSFELLDMAADAAGVLCGWALAFNLTYVKLGARGRGE